MQQPQQRFKSIYTANDDATRDLARFLAKNKLVAGGLTKFDDKPESYLSWKATFKSTIKDLSLSATEEINLLIKWLGPEQARRVKAVNIYHQSAGLDMIWVRLEECYGSPEAIERSLFSRIENFPKLSSKEPHKLRELSDLLCELKAAKIDGYLPGLSYLDTARGVSPIVEKQPYHLQEKWTTVGSKLKEDYNVSFPPLSFFYEFVRKEARARNDPSFTTATLSSVNFKKEKLASSYNTRPSVAVHKTEVSTDVVTTIKNAAEDISRQCPIHHKPHPLKRCRGFTTMLFEDRKSFIKGNNICYCCLVSTSHQAKYCNATIKCVECDSEKHLAALYPGPAPQMLRPFSSSKEHGGDSCSKICLVNVIPEGQHHISKRVYAIMDNQSNQSHTP